MKIKMTNLRKEKGITLVALVITIVILIILATITINAVLGENGFLKQAQKTKESAENTIQSEDEKMSGITQEYANIMAEDTELDLPFVPHETPEPETGGQEMSTMLYGVIEIKWLKGTSYEIAEEPNAPITKSISNGTMELIKFNKENQEWESGVEYSYEKGEGTADNTSSKWANARVTINGVESYFVWIPRYAYRIVYFDSNDSKTAYLNGTLTEEQALAGKKILGYSDSRGIVDAEGKKIDSVASTTKIMASEDYFMVHPAFMNGRENGFENGEWNKEIEGLWIGKFESARSDSIGTTQGQSTTIKVQPGVTSFRNITIGNMYTYAKAYSTELNSHMLKNSEWGAVAYLTESIYGRNGNEITKNTNSSYLTGGESGNAYIETNQNQSSTGNVYGIYDLRGGAWEHVAGYHKGGSLGNGAFATGTSDVYSTAYENDVEKTGYKYGDATYETHGWHQDSAYFWKSGRSFFIRGGNYINSEDTTGVFYFDCYDGNASFGGSFRLGLVM